MKLVAVICLAGLAVATAAGSQAAGPAHAPAVGGELIVGFEPGVGKAARTAVADEAAASVERELPQIHAGVVAVHGDPAAAAAALARDPRVRYVEPNYLVSTTAIPNDPLFGQLYGLDNTGQTGGTADADIDAPEAWNVTTGSANVTVAVIDTGVDFSHPDLASQRWVNTGENCGSTDATVVCAQRGDGVDNDGDGLVDDWSGWDYANNDNNPFDDNRHGTHVSGTIGARGDNGIGVAGVAWNVRIMPLKFLGSNGSGDTADGLRAILYAADHGADVASNSWGGDDFSQAMLDAIDYGAGKGMLFVAAAGNGASDNDGASPLYPAGYSQNSSAVLAVAATDSRDALASFSNWGATTVGLGAPGVGILSTVPGGGYASFSGTSMATPHVSGAAALVQARFPAATPYTTKALLLGTVDPVPSLAGKTISGGRLNAANAVSCSGSPELLLDAPRTGFQADLGHSVQVRAIGADCAAPAGAASVHVTVNGAPVTLTASSPDSGLYTGSFTPTANGPLTVSASLTVGSSTVTRTATGSASGDTVAPTAPSSLKLAIAGTRQAILTWKPSTDNIGVTGYDVYRDGTKVGTTATPSFLDDQGLVPASTHKYLVKATDAAGNASAASSTLNVKTASLSGSTGTAGGAVFDVASGAPVANVVVSTTVGSTVKQTKTNASGVYKLSNLPPGTYVLTCKLGARTAQTTVTVSAGETVLSRVFF